MIVNEWNEMVSFTLIYESLVALFIAFKVPFKSIRFLLTDGLVGQGWRPALGFLPVAALDRPADRAGAAARHRPVHLGDRPGSRLFLRPLMMMPALNTTCLA